LSLMAFDKKDFYARTMHTPDTPERAALARTDFEPADAERVAGRLEQLFGASAAAPFADRYLPLLQRDVDVTVGHAALRKAITALRRG